MKNKYNFFIKTLCSTLIVFSLILSISTFHSSIYAYDKSNKIVLKPFYIMDKKTTFQLIPDTLDETDDSEEYTYSSSNKRIAKVSNSGLVTSKQCGVTRITVTDSESGEKICSTKIYVGKKAKKLKISSQTNVIMKGNYIMLKAYVTPSNTAYKKIKYTSSNSAIAKVSSKGKITGVSAGSAIITVTTLDGSNLSKTFEITVLENSKTQSTENNDNTSVFPNPFFKNSVNKNITYNTSTASEDATINMTTEKHANNTTVEKNTKIK